MFVLVSYLLSVMICIFVSCDVKAMFAQLIVIRMFVALVFHAFMLIE